MSDSASLVSLKSGPLTALIAPKAGGSLARFAAGNIALMRPAPDLTATDPLTMACYPLLPFAGRTAFSHFTFEGQEVVLEPHPISAPHALHGIGWQRAWDVTEAGEASATITLKHDGATGWPWAFEAMQRFTLDDTSLTIHIAIRNLANEAMPAGVGLHPFFPNRQTARMEGELPFIWESGAHSLPTSREPVTAVRNFANGRRIAPMTLDHCFSGGKGPIDITWEDQKLGVRIHGREAGHTVVYTPQAYDFFCVEPVTMVPNGLNRLEGADVTGLTVLKRDETLAMTVKFEVRGLA